MAFEAEKTQLRLAGKLDAIGRGAFSSPLVAKSLTRGDE
jgi:hypothetical protein